jgi:hypothetical protein
MELTEYPVRAGISRNKTREFVMFNGTYDRAARAARYRRVVAEYTGLSEATADQFLRSYYLRIAEQYMVRIEPEVRALRQENFAALASTADAPSLQP